MCFSSIFCLATPQCAYPLHNVSWKISKMWLSTFCRFFFLMVVLIWLIKRIYKIRNYFNNLGTNNTTLIKMEALNSAWRVPLGGKAEVACTWQCPACIGPGSTDVHGIMIMKGRSADWIWWLKLTAAIGWKQCAKAQKQWRKRHRNVVFVHASKHIKMCF